MRAALLIAVLIYGVVSLVSYLVDGASDQVAYQDPVVQLEYCPMWKIWHDQKAAGIPVEERYGWPDRAGRYFEECSQ